jgi:capsular polysaccharide biosynthesis protein
LPVLPQSVDIARLQALTAEVLAHPNGEWHLNDLLGGFEKTKEPELAVALFESVYAQRAWNNYWIFAGLCRVYEALGRFDAGFLCAARAAQLDPGGPAGPAIYGTMLRFFLRQNRSREAAEVYLTCMEKFPGAKIATPQQLKPVLEALGLSAAPAESGVADVNARRNHLVLPASVKPAWVCPSCLGGALPEALALLAKPEPRAPVYVAELPQGELLVADEQVLVLSANGVLQRDMSVAPQPDLMLAGFKRGAANGQAVEEVSVPAAVVIQCHLAGHNYGHFLIDQMPRLALFEAVGVDVRQVTVVGPEVTTEFQRQIIEALGVKRYIGTRRRLRIKAGKLWASSDGAKPIPIAHYGEAWGMNFTRTRLGLPVFEPAARASTGQRRLYVSRNDSEGRHVVNEAEILPLLQAHGFERITPEKLSFLEQVALFRDASHVVGPHGAGLSNIIFAPQGLNFLEFFHPLFTPNNFAQLSPVMGMRYAALVGRDARSEAPECNDPKAARPWDPALPYPWRFGDMRVDPAALASWLAALA